MAVQIFRYGISGPGSGISPPEAKFFILATACVTPKPVPRLVRTLPQDRLSDYVKACARWLSLDDDRLGTLVIVENSGYDPALLGNGLLAELESRGQSLKRGMEIITYRGPDRPSGIHYGYSEFQMIDDLLDQCLSIKKYPLFIKATGRYIYPHIDRLLNKCDFHKADNFGGCYQKRLTFLCDSKIIPGFLWRQQFRTTSVGLFITDFEFFNSEIRCLYRTMKNAHRHTHIEDVIFDKLLPLHGHEGIFLRFPVNCEPRGIGGNGDQLGGPSKVIKAWIKSVARIIFPGLWL